jgi:hypothetical protein
MVPITLIAIVVLTTDFRTFTFLNKTLLGAASTSEPNSSTDSACCTLPVAFGALVVGLVMFLIFVTIAGVLGQDSTAFCNGYVRRITTLLLEKRTN